MTHEQLPNSQVKKQLDGMVNVQAFGYIVLRQRAQTMADIPDDAWQAVRPNLEAIHQWNHQLERLSFYASAREQAEHPSARALDPLAWVPFAQQGFRRLDRYLPGVGTVKPPLLTERKRTMQRQVFADMVDHRVFAEGVPEDCTGREYALMAATGRILMRAEAPPVV